MICKFWCRTWLNKPISRVQEGAIRQTIIATIPTTTNRFQDRYSPPPSVRREFIVPTQAPLNQNDNDGLPTYEQVIKMNHQIQTKVII